MFGINSQQYQSLFPTFYGSFNGIKSSFNYDISDEYDDYKDECWFHNL